MADHEAEYGQAAVPGFGEGGKAGRRSPSHGAPEAHCVVCGHGFRVEHRALIARECLSAEGIEEEPEQQAVLLCLALLLLFWLQAQQKGVFIQHLKLAGNTGALGMVSR